MSMGHAPPDSEFIESDTDQLKELAGMDPRGIYKPLASLRHALGIGIDLRDDLPPGEAFLMNTGAGWAAQLDMWMRRIQLTLRGCHEGGEYRLGVMLKLFGEWLERAATFWGVCWWVGRTSLLHMLGVYPDEVTRGISVPKLVNAFGTTYTVLTKRLGEVGVASIAILSPHQVVRRGPSLLPSDHELAAYARGGKKPKSIQMIRFPDAKHRIGFLREV